MHPLALGGRHESQVFGGDLLDTSPRGECRILGQKGVADSFDFRNVGLQTFDLVTGAHHGVALPHPQRGNQKGG